MFFIYTGDWILASVLFILANIGANGSFVFYDALLPHIARDDEVDRVSTAGYALGYLGGGTLLALNLAWILKPEWFGLPVGEGPVAAQARCPVGWRFCRSRSGGWCFRSRCFAAFPSRAARGGLTALGKVRELPIRAAVDRLIETGRSLRRYRQALLMLLAFLIYNDGIGTIMRMAAIYATEIHIQKEITIAAILIVQFVGIPCAFLFGSIAGRIGAKRSIAHRAVGLCGDLRRWLLHDDRDPLPGAGDPGRVGAGGNAGPEPLALCQPDSARQVGGVLRVLRGRREIRRHLRAGECSSSSIE